VYAVVESRVQNEMPCECEVETIERRLKRDAEESFVAERVI
jgi:hypothetical protein